MYVCVLVGRLSPIFSLFLPVFLVSMSRGNDRDESETIRERKKRKACASLYLQVKCHEWIHMGQTTAIIDVVPHVMVEVCFDSIHVFLSR